jgi:hypothetical protein
MKKLLIISFFAMIAFSKEVKAQTYGVPDTLTYLQSIVANKAQFIGHPFSVLRDSLKIEIKLFSPFASISYNKTKETSTSFAFYFPQSDADHYLSYPRIEIYWQTYLNINQSDAIRLNNNRGQWNSLADSFYTTGIIADIQIRE